MNDSVTLRVTCLRHGKCSNFLQLLHLTLNLESELSKIVNTCSRNTFNYRDKHQSMDDFMQTFFF